MFNREDEEISHPSFGQISFSRVNSTGTRFYGSELPQDHYICLEINESQLKKSLTDERYFANKRIVQLRLTTGQFSELITSLNVGSGVPCTLEFVNGYVEPLPDLTSRKEYVHHQFKERMAEFAQKIRKNQQEAIDIVKKKTLSNEDIRVLSLNLNYLTTEIEKNIPFFAECFQETMDKVVFEAKTEIDNAIQHKINVMGIEALQNQRKAIEGTQESQPTITP